MYRIEDNKIVYYQFKHINDAGGVKHGMFTRKGGVSTGPLASLNVGSTVGDDLAHVLENRQRMANALGVRDADVRTTWQAHGADVLVARHDQPQKWPPEHADGIITAEPDLPLSMRFADCVPLVFYDSVQQVLGLAHAGWRGTVAGAGVATVETMRDAFDCNPADILAGIGPSIGPEHYEVGSEVVEQVREVFENGDDLLHPSEQKGHAYFDLWKANRILLEAAGVRQISVAGISTYQHTDEFFSHRAEHGITGRFGVLAVMTNGASA